MITGKLMSKIVNSSIFKNSCNERTNTSSHDDQYHYSLNSYCVNIYDISFDGNSWIATVKMQGFMADTKTATRAAYARSKEESNYSTITISTNTFPIPSACIDLCFSMKFCVIPIYSQFVRYPNNPNTITDYDPSYCYFQRYTDSEYSWTGNDLKYWIKIITKRQNEIINDSSWLQFNNWPEVVQKHSGRNALIKWTRVDNDRHFIRSELPQFIIDYIHESFILLNDNHDQRILNHATPTLLSFVWRDYCSNAFLPTDILDFLKIQFKDQYLKYIKTNCYKNANNRYFRKKKSKKEEIKLKEICRYQKTCYEHQFGLCVKNTQEVKCPNVHKCAFCGDRNHSWSTCRELSGTLKQKRKYEYQNRQR